MKGSRGLNYDERPTALKLQSLEKRRLWNDLVLTHKILYKQMDLFKLSRRPGLVISSLRLLHLTGRKRRRRNSFAYRVVKHWNCRIAHSIFAPIWSFWARCPFPFTKCIHSYLCKHVSERALDEWLVVSIASSTLNLLLHFKSFTYLFGYLYLDIRFFLDIWRTKSINPTSFITTTGWWLGSITPCSQICNKLTYFFTILPCLPVICALNPRHIIQFTSTREHPRQEKKIRLLRLLLYAPHAKDPITINNSYLSAVHALIWLVHNLLDQIYK